MICAFQKKLLPTAFALIFLPCVLANCARAQTVDLSTDQAVLAELQKRVDAKRDEPGKKGESKLDAKSVCIRRLKESAKVIAIGFRTDRCHFDGAFIKSRYFEQFTDYAALSKNALDALGWETANQRQR